MNGLDLSIEKIDLQNQDFRFDSLTLNQPYLQFELFDSSNNFFEFLGIQPSSQSDSAMHGNSEKDSLESLSVSPASYALNSFIIQDGIIDYTDHRTLFPTILQSLTYLWIASTARKTGSTSMPVCS